MTDLHIDATGNDLTYRITGAAMAVHNRLGPGYKEEVNERDLAKELMARGMAVQRQYQVEVVSLGVVVALFIIDLFVESVVVVECKPFSHQLTSDEIAQVINYLKATQAPVALVFNFGRRRLGYRRVFPGPNAAAPIQRLGRDNVKKANLPDPT